MSKIRTNFVSGNLSDALLTNSGASTTMNSAGLSSLATIASPDTCTIIIDPQAINGAPEIVTVTTHTAAATTATVTRQVEGSALRAHLTNEFWIHAPTALDGNVGWLTPPVQVTTSQIGISTITDLTGLTTTVNLNGNQKIRVAGYVLVQQQTSGGTCILSIYEGATQLTEALATLAASSYNTFFISWTPLSAPSNGSHTYKLRLTTGSGTVDTQAATTFPNTITVEGMGS